MSRAQLEQSLERLRGELEALDAAGGATAAGDTTRLRALIDEVESQLDALESGEDDDGTLVDGLRTQIEQFEVEHPRVTAILNDIMVTLSNMGI